MLPVRLSLVDGQVIDAELRMRKGASGWLIWDAGAGGTSLVRLYSGDIGTEAAAHGVPQVIESLRESAARNRARDLETARKPSARRAAPLTGDQSSTKHHLPSGFPQDCGARPPDTALQPARKPWNTPGAAGRRQLRPGGRDR